MPTVGNRPPIEAPVNRWVQLVAGVICMVMIANLQYGWTYFVDPIDAKFHWGRTSIQVAFTIFVATETWLVPIEGWFVDRFGPRIVVMFGGIVVAGAWTLNSFASTLPMLYTAAAISGVPIMSACTKVGSAKRLVVAATARVLMVDFFS